MDDALDGPRYVPFDGTPHTVSMGLRPLRLESWLEPDGRRAADLAAKEELLRTRSGDVVATLPLGDDASRETLALVLAEVRSRGLVGPHDRLPDGLHPIDAAGRLVQEDLCVMAHDDAANAWVLAAASVCSPSRWLLADKIGRSLAAIHDPVPGYEAIRGSADRFLDRIKVDRPVWRTNWTLLDDPEPFQPRSPTATGDRAVGDVWLRVERQTLRRLPGTGAVLFTIRTYVDALDALSPTARADLAATLEHIGPDLVAYRGWGTLLPTVRARLAEG